jgi:hypothetical protein
VLRISAMRASLAFLLVAASFEIGGCGSGSEGDVRSTQITELATTCRATGTTVCPHTPPSYANDVVPILDRDCNLPCHSPGLGPWPLTNYDDVSAWAVSIQTDVASCAMPPPDAGVLTGQEQATLLDWVACGAPYN